MFFIINIIYFDIFDMYLIYLGFPGGSVEKNPPVNAEDIGDAGLNPEFRRSAEGGNSNPL